MRRKKKHISHIHTTLLRSLSPKFFLFSFPQAVLDHRGAGKFRKIYISLLHKYLLLMKKMGRDKIGRNNITLRLMSRKSCPFLILILNHPNLTQDFLDMQYLSVCSASPVNLPCSHFNCILQILKYSYSTGIIITHVICLRTNT